MIGARVAECGFDVFERENAFYFYLPGTDILVAYSYKVEKRPMM